MVDPELVQDLAAGVREQVVDGRRAVIKRRDRRQEGRMLVDYVRVYARP
jgi:hypothetical protein